MESGIIKYVRGHRGRVLAALVAALGPAARSRGARYGAGVGRQPSRQR